ncbi:MAG: tRNA dihydrouridine synthase DusB [Bacteroidia bacterium]|nr:MAG: tRNA dihydrouridine synthase DusB [Bacteroidia bacterium]
MCAAQQPVTNLPFLAPGQYPLFLAPMEDVTDVSFRRLCKEFGADVVCTEFVNSDALARGVPASLAKLRVLEEERPVGIQIYGQHLESMVAAAKLADAAAPNYIDLNFGCPVKKIAGRGAGAGMLRNVPLMLQMVRAVVAEVSRPVTVKTRLGWDANSIIIEELAGQLQDAGIAALTIHGRTRAQLYTGQADWGPIARVRANPRMRIPIIGNGDIRSPEDAHRAFHVHRVDGVMIGRASYGMPWIFRDIKHFLLTGEQPTPLPIEERVAVAHEHLELSVAAKGELRGIFEIRRHLACYFKGLPHFKELRLQLLTEREPARLHQLLDTVLQRYRGWQPDAGAPYTPWDS